MSQEMENSGGHDCHAGHEHSSAHTRSDVGKGILTVRCHSGISGDMLLAGLAVINMQLAGITPDSCDGRDWLATQLGLIMPVLSSSVKIVEKKVGGINGWHASVELPHEHEHRNLADIRRIIGDAGISAWAAEKAEKTFELLAQCEAQAHGRSVDEVHFHEVGALDSILDICAVCEFYGKLQPAVFVCGPLPMADGQVQCAHGIIPAPAPAVLKMLEGIPVRTFEGEIDAGELVTPTAIALLRALGAEFGGWPCFTVEHTALVYGAKIFANAPNGAIFVFGEK